jgi:hypothetical protein
MIHVERKHIGAELIPWIDGGDRCKIRVGKDLEEIKI